MNKNTFAKDILELATARHICFPVVGPYNMNDDAYEALAALWRLDNESGDYQGIIVIRDGHNFLMDYAISFDGYSPDSVRHKTVGEIFRGQLIKEEFLLPHDTPLDKVMESFVSCNPEDYSIFEYRFVVQNNEIIGFITSSSLYSQPFQLYILAVFLQIEHDITKILGFYQEAPHLISVPEWERAEKRAKANSTVLWMSSGDFDNLWESFESSLEGEADYLEGETEEEKRRSFCRWREESQKIHATEDVTKLQNRLYEWNPPRPSISFDYCSFSAKLRAIARLGKVTRAVSALSIDKKMRKQRIDKCVALRNCLVHPTEITSEFGKMLPVEDIVQFMNWLLLLEAELDVKLRALKDEEEEEWRRKNS